LLSPCAGARIAVDKVAALAERARKLEKEIDALKARLAGGAGADLAASAVDVRV